MFWEGGAVTLSFAAPTPTIPQTVPEPSQATRQTFRALLRKGMTIGEASNLTAYMCGIPLNDVQWSLAQVNRLLFIRELHRTGRIGEDGVTPRLH